MSQNVPKMTVSGYSHLRFGLPGPPLTDQWRGVYYASSISNRQKRLILLQRKQCAAVEKAKFRALNVELLQQDQDHQTRGFASHHERFVHMLRLNSVGLVENAAPHFDVLCQDRALTNDQHAQAIRSLASPRLQLLLLRTAANYDKIVSWKLCGDRNGNARLNEAERILDCIPGNVISTMHYNALMEVALTCGYNAAQRVSEQLYDAIGVARVPPSIRTYEMVIYSLGMQGRAEESRKVMTWLRAHHASAINIATFNALLAAFRGSKMFDSCDILWNELCDNRNPAPNIETAETYLRSIVDLSYTPVAAPMLNYGEIHAAEKKRIPWVLCQMERLGIPEAHLSPPLDEEVRDALRKFAIRDYKFYNWGRAKKIFDFIEFRRSKGWMYDLEEMMPPVLTAPFYWTPRLQGNEGNVWPAGTAVLPGKFAAKDPWNAPPLSDVLNLRSVEEHFNDTRTAEKHYEKVTSLHDRGPNWMSEVPQTRYDGAYGLQNPNLSRLGIRRHMNYEFAGLEEAERHDKNVLRQTTSAARRVRQKLESTRTHRNSE